ncbi:MAG: hypothetical protein AMXMBFR26_24100 [Porticoccaceae bacterium]
MKERKAGKKSPLKAKPLRNPGETLDNQIRDIFLDDVVMYFMIALPAVILAMFEWLRWYNQSPPNPWLFTVIASVAVTVAAYKIRSALAKVPLLKAGRDGEKAVGQYLESLRRDGAEIFHDVPGDGFNVDHVIIHASGVYAVETKILAKPVRGEARLIFDGQTIRNGAFTPDRNPVVQVSAAATWLRELLKNSTGQTIPVRPVVVYPGWFIEPTAEARSSSVWVLNPKALPSFIGHSAEQLRKDQVQLCAFHLGRYVRAIP